MKATMKTVAGCSKNILLCNIRRGSWKEKCSQKIQNPGFYWLRVREYCLGFGFLSQVQLIVCFSEEEENTVLKPFLNRFRSGVMYTFQITGELNSVNEA